MLQLWIGGAHSQGLLRDVGGDLQEDLQESPRLVVTVDNAGRVVGLDTSRQNVDGESEDADCRKAEDNLCQKMSVESEACGGGNHRYVCTSTRRFQGDS